MARRRTRRNPIRTTGALIINPRRRKRNPARRTRRNALQIRTNRKRRTNRRRTRRNALQIRTNRRRSTRRNPRSRRRNTRVARRNTRSRRRNTRSRRRNTRVRRRNGTRRGMRRRTARRAYAKRRNRRTRKNMGTMLKKIPLVGGLLASMAALIPTTLFGAIMVEPTMMAAKLIGRYIPNLPAPLFYALAGLVVAAIVKSKLIPLAAATKDRLAIAAASAAGGVAYYKFRTSGGAPETVADEVGALELRGYSGPLGLLELRGLGGLSRGFSGAYGDYGPTAVMPLGTY